MKNRPSSPVPQLVLVLTLLAASGCVDERVVFQDRELFEEPLSEAGAFLGYTDSDDKLTVCGNCHVGPQAEWVETAHADAWDGLQDSGHAQAFCEGCHTVTELGNITTGTVGHAATGAARYQDVQCESCHGPGLAHVTDPNDATVPLAPMDVGLDQTLGCAECHQGAHHPFADEWAESAHGQVNAYPAGRPECTSCHTGEGALAMMGVKTSYLEQADVAEPGEHMAITCAVCHDPHGSDNPAQLRFPIDAPDVEQNLCMMCHNKRGTPDPTTFRGPHAPEGPTLLGVAGWWPPNMSFPGGRIIGTHGSPEANPGLCASCHVQSFEVTDLETDDLLFESTGHSFQATPCVDADGIPTDAADCAPEGPTLLGVAGWWPPNMSFPGGRVVGTHGSPEANPGLCASCHVQAFEVTDLETDDLLFESTGHSFQATPCVDGDGIPTGAADCTPEERSFATCATAGCHGTPDVARGLQINAENQIAADADDLEALIAQIPETEFDETDDRYTVGEGARFNLELARSPGAAVHNPFLIEALLQATITEVESRYSVAAPPRAAALHGGR